MNQDISKQYFREISEKVESGEFFIEAREWYLSTYINRFFERSYLVIIFSMIMGLMGLTTHYYMSILPIKQSVPIQVEIEDSSVLSTRISYMGTDKKDFSIDEIMLKYFSGRFVEALESYDFKEDFKKLKRNKNIIDTLGNQDISMYYDDLISLRSGNSIILKYKKDVIREVFINPEKIEVAFKERSIDNPDINKYEVTVNFTVRELDKYEGINLSEWQAKIGLNFENIRYIRDKKDFSPLNFKVYSYRSYEIASTATQPANNDSQVRPTQNDD